MKHPPIIHSGRKFYLNARGYWLAGSGSNPRSLHGVIWQETYGPIPPGHHIHHRDENKSNNAIENLQCIPGGAHISLHKKGTTGHIGLRGEACPTVKLTEAQVLEIRATYVRGRNGGQRALAEKYGVSPSAISHAISGVHWAHLEGAYRPPLASYCQQGHEYTPENTKILNGGTRRCRTCFGAYRRQVRAKQRAEKRAARLAAKALRA